MVSLDIVPAITLFVESREEAVRRGYPSRARFLEERVFTTPLLARLSRLGAGLAVATYPEEEGIGTLVTEASRHGIEVSLWLNLPRELGYWQSRRNVREALRAADRLLCWIERRALRVERVGVDVEPSLTLAGAFANKRLAPLARELIAVQRSPGTAAEFERLLALINQRCGVELYKLPVWGELAPLRALLGLFAPPPGFLADARNRVVSMLYSSVAPPRLRRGLVGRLWRRGEHPALGVISADQSDPGVVLPFSPRGRPPAMLGEDQLAHDLAQVREATALYLFALNGAGVLDKLERGLSAARVVARARLG